MARKPLLLGVLLLALAVSVWWIARDGSSAGEVGVAQDRSQAKADSAAVPGVVPPQATPPDARSVTPLEAEAAPAKLPAMTPSGYFVRGKIVDARRFAAAGAEVSLVRADGSVISVHSDEHGAFEIAIPERSEKYETASLWATRAEDTAVRSIQLAGSKPSAMSGMLFRPQALGDVDAGTLALRGGSRMQISVVESGQPVADAEVRLWLGAEPTVLWRATSGASGVVTTPALPAGGTNVQGVHGASSAQARVYLPEEVNLRLELRPSFEGAITLVEKQTGAAISGATIEITEMVRAPSSPDNSRGMGLGDYITSRAVKDGKKTTDAEGIARFSNLCPDVEYQVSAKPAGFSSYPPQGSGGDRLKSLRPALRLELEPLRLRPVRWPIEVGEIPAPTEGSRVTLLPAPGNSRERFGEQDASVEATVQGANVFAEGVEGGKLMLGTAADGAIASFWVDSEADVGRAVSFRRPRTIEVLVRDNAGVPVAGASAAARNQGNNPLGKSAQTDAEGLAKLTGLYGELAEVYVLPPNAGPMELRAGTVNLKTGDGRVELTLPTISIAKMRARLEVRIDGVAQLPPEYQLSGAGVLEERPETGELVLWIAIPDKGDEVGVSISSAGFRPGKAKLPIVRDGSEPRAVMNLVHSATLTVHVTMPRTKDAVEIKIQAWDAFKQAWGPAPGYYNGLHTPNGPDGAFRFFQLLPGRYQVADDQSKVESEPVEIAEGQREAQVALDLDGLEWVTGRIEVLDASELTRARVLNSTARLSLNAAWLPAMSPPEGVYVSPDGSFKMRVKRGVPMNLRAWHPWLAPAEPGGSIALDGGRDGVVLKLVEGNQVRIAAPQLVELPRFKAARVAVYAGAAAGEPQTWVHAPLIDGVLRFTGVPTGRATLWIDPGREYAPLVLTDVSIAPGITDLGPVSFSRGSSFKVKLTVKEGEAAPRIYIFARRETAPALNRELNSNGSAEVILSGLEAGEYSVSYNSIMGQKAAEKRLMQFDGKTDVEVALDLR